MELCVHTDQTERIAQVPQKYKNTIGIHIYFLTPDRKRIIALGVSPQYAYIHKNNNNKKKNSVFMVLICQGGAKRDG